MSKVSQTIFKIIIILGIGVPILSWGIITDSIARTIGGAVFIFYGMFLPSDG